MFSNLNLTDMECCYKLFTREVFDQISLEENRFGFEPEVTAKVARLGARIYEVPVTYSGRTYEEGKKINWKDGFSALRLHPALQPLGKAAQGHEGSQGSDTGARRHRNRCAATRGMKCESGRLQNNQCKLQIAKCRSVDTGPPPSFCIFHFAMVIGYLSSCLSLRAFPFTFHLLQPLAHCAAAPAPSLRWRVLALTNRAGPSLLRLVRGRRTRTRRWSRPVHTMAIIGITMTRSVMVTAARMTHAGWPPMRA